MSNKNNFVPLIYDMYYLFDHSFNNERFKSLNIEILEKNENKLKFANDKKAIQLLSNQFENFQDLDKIDKKLYKVKCFYDKNKLKEITEIYTLIYINSGLLEKYVKNNSTIPNFDFLMCLCLLFLCDLYHA